MNVDSQDHSYLDSKLKLVSGYLALPVNLASSSLIKYLLFRPYKIRKNATPSQPSDDVDCRTLYITNLAPHINERDLINLFGACGTIVSIRLDSRERPSPSGEVNVASALATMIQMKKEEQNIAESAAQNEFLTSRLKRLERNILGEAEIGKASFESSGFALVVFEEESAIDFAMNQLTSMSCFGKSEKGAGKKSHGLKKWLKDWSEKNEGDPKELQKQADIALQQYDKRQREQKRMEEKLSSTQDGDGWTLVAARGRKKSKAAEGTVGTTSLSQNQLRLLKADQDKKTHFDDFYKFQKNDFKANRLESLKRRFAKDKAQIRKLQQSTRKFNQ